MGDLALSVYGGTSYAYPSAGATASSATEAAYGSSGGGGGNGSWLSILNPLTSHHGVSILGAVLAVAVLIIIRQSLPA